MPTPAKIRRARARKLRQRLEQLTAYRESGPSPLEDDSVYMAALEKRRKQRRKQRLESFAGENRDDLTAGEAAMQAILSKLGWRFNTEHPIRNYILDFYVHAYKLAIEVDGGYHLSPEQAERDRKRDLWLVSNGYTVVRLTNEQVLRFPLKTKATLRQAVEAKNTRKVSARMLPSSILRTQEAYSTTRKLFQAAYRLSR